MDKETVPVQSDTQEYIADVADEAVPEPTFQDEYRARQSLLDQYTGNYNQLDSSFFESEEDDQYKEQEEEQEEEQFEDEQIADLITSEAIRTTDGKMLELIETDTISYIDYSQKLEDFDIGTAVIYSIIINRKEY
jgi:hypothetical protein